MIIILQPFDPGDYERLMGWIHSEADLVQWSGPFFAYPLDIPQLECYYDSGLKQPPLRRIFKAVDPALQQVVGHIELNNIDWRNLAGTVSKVLVDPQLRGHSYAAPMVQQLLHIAFDELHLHRIDLRVFDFNTPAVRAYQHVGFQIEGHLRDYRKVGGDYWSSYLMAILEQDWQDAKAQEMAGDSPIGKNIT